MVKYYGAVGGSFPYITTVMQESYSKNIATLLGGNVFGIEMAADLIGWNDSVDPVNSMVKRMNYIRQGCNEAGVALNIHQMNDLSETTACNMSYERAKIYFNIGNARTTFLNHVKQWQQTFNPEIHWLGFEPETLDRTLAQYASGNCANSAIYNDILSWGKTSAQWYQAYDDLCDLFEQTIHSVNQNALVVFSTMPFTDAQMHADNIPVINKTNVAYSVNFHWCLHGYLPTYPTDQWVKDYWYATTDAQFANARQGMFDYMDTKRVLPITSKGVPIYFAEWGGAAISGVDYATNGIVPTRQIKAHVHDLMDYCEMRNVVGHEYFGYAPFTRTNETDFAPIYSGLLGSDGNYTSADLTNSALWNSLSPLGKFWRDEVAGTPLGVQLPFHDPFATLDSKWTQINGTWNVS